MQNIDSRLTTFDQRWRKQKINTTPAQIAEVGFFFLRHNDFVECWHCGGILSDWKRDDDPWVAHVTWYPTCQFVLQEKGADFIFRLVRLHPNLTRPKIYTEDTCPVSNITPITCSEKKS